MANLTICFSCLSCSTGRFCRKDDDEGEDAVDGGGDSTDDGDDDIPVCAYDCGNLEIEGCAGDLLARHLPLV